MSLLILLAVQAAGQEIRTFYPLPPKEQQQEELRNAQGLPPLKPAPAPAEGTEAAKPPQPPAPPPKPVPIEVVTVKKVAADANVIFVPDSAPQPPQQPK